MEILLARQPIYDIHLRVAGYELLYRELDSSPSLAPGDRASAKVAVNTLLELGFDRVLGKHPAYINCTRNFLVHEHFAPLPPERTVLEVLEDVEPEPAVIEALRRARASGYCIALDDFVYSPRLEVLLELADVVKVDVRAVELRELRNHARLLQRPGLRLLAEKVETQEEFHYCRDAGYDLFQGFFFCRPRLVSGHRAPTERLSLLQLLARIHDPQVAVEDIETLVARNVAISYKLLHFVNSAIVGLPRHIDSLRNAIVMLGLQRVRTCVVLLLFSGFDDKPHELSVTALVRAKLCQLLAEGNGLGRSEVHFTVGLFSVLDALMDTPMQELVDGLPLSDEVRAALLRREGEAGEILRTALACERADWEAVLGSSSAPSLVQRAYVDALSWAGEIERQLAGAAAAAA